LCSAACCNLILIHFSDATESICAISICRASRLRTVASGQLLALQDLQEQLNRQGWQALEAEREASQLRAQLAAAQASDESAQQDVKRLGQQLAGSQAAAAQNEQELVTQVQSDNVCTRLSCTSLML